MKMCCQHHKSLYSSQFTCQQLARLAEEEFERELRWHGEHVFSEARLAGLSVLEAELLRVVSEEVFTETYEW